MLSCQYKHFDTASREYIMHWVNTEEIVSLKGNFAALDQENSAFSANIAHIEEFIASIYYIYHQHWLDIHIKRSNISL